MRNLLLLLSIVTLLLFGVTVKAENGHPWYLTFEQVGELYKTHYNRDGHLENYIHEMKDGKCVAPIGLGQVVMVHPSFILYMLSHLELALENGWVNYIFWPDLNHGHLFISRDYWDNKYSGDNSPTGEYLTRMLKEDEPLLGILYHAAEHFCRLDPNNKQANKTRNILGWFDGRPPELTYPDPEDTKEAQMRANTAGDPKGMDRRWFISVSAGKDGYFVIYPDGEEIRLDISFYVIGIYDSTERDKKWSTYY